MKAFHVICGLPRSGSTLLCNILAQNPAFHVLHTSFVPEIMAANCDAFSNNPNIKGLLAKDPERARRIMRGILRAVAEESSETDKVCFDKNRMWNALELVLSDLAPESKFIAMIRDPRGVMGSIEKQHRVDPYLAGVPGLTRKARVQNAFGWVPGGGQGMIGEAILGVEDLVLSGNKNVLLLKYEDLAEDPRFFVGKVYDHIRQPWYEHDFEDIHSTAMDPDWIYLNKFPHDGTGRVEAREDWQSYIPPALAGDIVAAHRGFMEYFGYVPDR